MTKYYIIAVVVIILAFSIWLTVLYFKINHLNATIAEKELIIADKDKTIAEANASIDIQNQKIEAFKVDLGKITKANEAEQSRIAARYEYLLKKAKEEQKKDPSCENTLKLIETSQKDFLYE